VIWGKVQDSQITQLLFCSCRQFAGNASVATFWARVIAGPRDTPTRRQAAVWSTMASGWSCGGIMLLCATLKKSIFVHRFVMAWASPKQSLGCHCSSSVLGWRGQWANSALAKW
jgi:hypothetical protein